MAIGVSRRDAAAHSWSAVQPEWAGSNKVAGADRGFIGVLGATRSPGVRGSGGGGGEDLVVEVAQGVVAAAGEFAGHRQQRQLAAEAGFDLLEVGVVVMGSTAPFEGRSMPRASRLVCARNSTNAATDTGISAHSSGAADSLRGHQPSRNLPTAAAVHTSRAPSAWPNFPSKSAGRGGAGGACPAWSGDLRDGSLGTGGRWLSGAVNSRTVTRGWG